MEKNMRKNRMAFYKINLIFVTLFRLINYYLINYYSNIII